MGNGAFEKMWGVSQEYVTSHNTFARGIRLPGTYMPPDLTTAFNFSMCVQNEREKMRRDRRGEEGEEERESYFPKAKASN